MSTSTTTPVSEAGGQAQGISPFGRVAGVFFSPKATFEDISRRPSWAAPIVLLTVIGLSLNILMVSKVDWRSFAEEQIMNSPKGQQIPADQRDLAIQRGAKGNQYFCYV